MKHDSYRGIIKWQSSQKLNVIILQTLLDAFELVKIKMAPTAPRNAYNLFFSFYKNIHANPSLQIDFERSRQNREQYKHFVLNVLNDQQDGPSLADDGGLQKFMGNKDFTGMSKKVGQEWKKVDSLTRSIFKELAKEGENENSKVICYLVPYHRY